jgi:hypothetical protein
VLLYLAHAACTLAWASAGVLKWCARCACEDAHRRRNCEMRFCAGHRLSFQGVRQLCEHPPVHNILSARAGSDASECGANGVAGSTTADACGTEGGAGRNGASSEQSDRPGSQPQAHTGHIQTGQPHDADKGGCAAEVPAETQIPAILCLSHCVMHTAPFAAL